MKHRLRNVAFISVRFDIQASLCSQERSQKPLSGTYLSKFWRKFHCQFSIVLCQFNKSIENGSPRLRQKFTRSFFACLIKHGSSERTRLPQFCKTFCGSRPPRPYEGRHICAGANIYSLSKVLKLPYRFERIAKIKTNFPHLQSVL